MSVWTHVTGCIRVDGMPGHGSLVENVEAILGPISTFEEPNDKTRLPCGSEGSLRYQIIEYGTGIAWLAIPVWGDLRDYSNVAEIRRWWEGLLGQLEWVRDAVLRVEVEGVTVEVFEYTGGEP